MKSWLFLFHRGVPMFTTHNTQLTTNKPMSKVVLIDPVQDPRWDKFVEDHPHGWVTHLSGWKQVLENTFKHINGYYFALIDEKSNKICAGLPVFHVKSRLRGNSLVSAPFASLFDPLVNDDTALEALIASIKKLSRDLNTSSYEMRTFLSRSFSNFIHLKCVKGYTHQFLSLKPSLPEIKQSFHRKTVRQSVNRSLKYNLDFYSDRNQKDLFTFYNLYFKTRKKMGTACNTGNFLSESL